MFTILGAGFLSTPGSLASTLGTHQPFRYRGYVYDVETGLYYLRSRYYKPGWGRFICADALIEGNLYSYCDNSPVIRSDSSGKSWLDDVAQFLIGVIDYVFPGSSDRANKVVSGKADWYDYVDWLTLGYASTVKGAVAPEKPLSFEHWVDSFTTIAVPFSFYTALAPKPPTKVGRSTISNPLSDPQYTNKVLIQMQRDAFHGFPSLIDTMATEMDITTLVGKDGVSYKLVQMPGSMSLGNKIYEGVFEYIIRPDGWINHRFFRPN